MAHDRSGTGPWAWIKVVGAQGEEMNADWRQNEQHLLSNVWFTRHPRSLRAGDVLVYYAAVWGRLVALMTLESDSDEARDNSSDPNDGRWRWSLPVRPVVTLPMKAGPTLTDVSIDPPRLRRKSATVDADVDLPEFDDSAPSEPHNTQHGGETQILFKSWSKAVEEAPRGWLQLVDSDQPPVPLRVGSARVGRHRENEICLMNMSVHRRHAVVHVSQDGVFSIHDLGTKNGVVVNGVRYNQRDLADGDLIELGEVKLRFVADEDNLPPSAAA